MLGFLLGSNHRNGHFHSKKKTAVGLSGGGRKGPIHIGGLIRLDEEIARSSSGQPALISSIDSLDSKSSGAIAAAGYVRQVIEFLHHPERYTGYKGPAHKLEEILQQNIDMYRLLNVWQFLWNLKEYKGFVDKKPLREFFKRLMDDMTFDDIPQGAPQLYITVNNWTTGNDIIFGEVGRKTKIRDVLEATVSVAGFIKDEGFHGPTLYGPDNELLATTDVDRLIDGGNRRKNTIAEVMRRGADMTIDVYLGRPQYPLKDETYFPQRTMLERVRLVRNLLEDVGIRLGSELQRKEGGEDTRDWYDYQIDAPMETGFTIDELVEGMGDGILAVTPQGKTSSLAGNGVPLGQARTGYEAMDRGIALYKTHHPETQPEIAPSTTSYAARQRVLDAAQRLGKRTAVAMRSMAPTTNITI